ncbi:hypothetical protein L3X38_037294 [Prunus dulcis]|uniref:Integrase catalytic domain-containing protein n=1 Tax=Prunus dulcis TaxID=3755 RepID=A0AAD4YPD7_PRUDU|nr:hypothetical protein L3X38_037294 [Prunus dulcis]
MASSPSIKVDGLLGMVTIRLGDDNFLKWSFQIESLLQGYDLFGHFDDSLVPPPKFGILDEIGVTSEVTAAYNDWLCTDKSLLSFLIATLFDEALEYVIGSKTASEAWLQLSDRYATVSRARINHLKTELQTAQKGADSIEWFLLRLKHIRDKLSSAGVPISDDDFMITILNGLPSEYDMNKTVLIARDSVISLKDYRAQLLAAEQTADARIHTHHALYMSSTSSPGQVLQHPCSFSTGMGLLPTPSVAYIGSHDASGFHNRVSGSQSFFGNGRGFSSGNGRGFASGLGRFSQTRHPSSDFRGGFSSAPASKFSVVPECQIYGKRGHTAVNCYHCHGDDSSKLSGSIIACQICGKRGHGALDCFHRSNYVYQGQAPPSTISAMEAHSSYVPPHGYAPMPTPSRQEMADHVWIADSGASHHMVADVSTLHDVTPCEFTDQVTVGNGEGLNITNIGTTALSCASTSLKMPSVFHVPKLSANLLFVNQLCRDNHCIISFDSTGFCIQDKTTKAILLKGSSRNGLYPIPCKVQSAQFLFSSPTAYLGQHVGSTTWHQRLGHPINEVVKLMLKESNMVVSEDAQFNLCSSCLQGKMHRLPFSSSHVKTEIPFSKIHSDVWGPSHFKSIHSFRYFVLFLDECTGFVWIYPLFNKSEVFSKFLKFFALVQTQFNAKIQHFQSDGGGEYISKPFTDFLANHGMLHQFTCPYTPQQNGMAERKNRHVVETALTLLTAANMPG